MLIVTMKACGLALRQKIIDALTATNQTQKQVADRFGVHRAIIQRYARLPPEQQPLGPKTPLGRPMKVSPEQEPLLGQLMAQTPWATVAEWAHS